MPAPSETLYPAETLYPGGVESTLDLAATLVSGPTFFVGRSVVPRENLYPSDTLYPEAFYDGGIVLVRSLVQASLVVSGPSFPAGGSVEQVVVYLDLESVLISGPSFVGSGGDIYIYFGNVGPPRVGLFPGFARFPGARSLTVRPVFAGAGRFTAILVVPSDIPGRILDDVRFEVIDEDVRFGLLSETVELEELAVEVPAL